MSKVGAAHNVRVLGSGETTVVLGHGFGIDQSVWNHLVPHLIDQYKVLLYDNMGIGTTNPDHYDFDRYSTLEGHASDLITILEEFKVGKCIFIGHSLSSMAAVIVSVSRPDLFHKLILLSSTPRMSNTVDYHGGLEQEQLDQILHELETNYNTVIVGMSPMVLGSSHKESVALQEYTKAVLNIRPDILLSTIRTLYRYDVRPLLPQVTVPCHIIHSLKDPLVPVAAAEYLHQNLGGKSVLEVMPIEGHLPHFISPEITNPVLLRHVQQDIADA
ncbi:probable esterase kai2 [Phtheirospermum japonicum]|uniref:KAI2d2 n=1 Tax=Phtheirospermum japonicum TaxID=374723 RepID=A0A2U8XQV8_9LAMI|nr:KAI2d2 [Phtheirospermum japonicum]BDE26419.1 putative alpha/beta hydrolase [Phtheirospermum japonicum]GFP78923.1 probable esterase kai2 [Phtheirospermum japonicum]